MKTEDLKNYIFEQLNETSPERATALARARDDEGLKASEAGYLAAKHSVKIQKNPKNLDQRKIDAMNSATVQLMDLASEKFSKARKARNRSLGRRGDGSPRTPTQESALNFINGLKRLTETSYKRATEYSKARGKQLSAASSASDSIKSEIDKRKLNGAPQEELAALSRDYKVSKDLVGKIGKKAIAGWLRTAEARKREAPPSIYYDPR